ncbi:hypothetical protein L5515_005026 [Caenorhabditis briggsae]|uniref:Uncharacterized protein n=1 Tax=Caenorhabditis briggsae TaxID=6238 RepID=A0AAE9EQH9_CAEBR|nr:hypothetical protein L5515_005026 [Caenorhabditis briggsae]
MEDIVVDLDNHSPCQLRHRSVDLSSLPMEELKRPLQYHFLDQRRSMGTGVLTTSSTVNISSSAFKHYSTRVTKKIKRIMKKTTNNGEGIA